MVTFSIVIETENLANGEWSDLEKCLDSLAAQGFERRRPNEIVVIESGQVGPAVLDALRARYPWLTVHLSPMPLHYYDAKMLGVARTTGDVVVFADSDLVYERGWLDSLLQPFENPDVDIVSGETRIDITGPYTFSVGTTWLFPRRYAPGSARSLIANNAAVRRSAILSCPFPTHLPLYRSQIVLHGRMARARGLGILNVQARGLHAPPAGARQWALRFAISGADTVNASTYDIGSDGRLIQSSSFVRRIEAWVRITARKVASSVVRTVQALAENPSRLVYLPVAVPISAAALALFAAGGLSAVLGSDVVYRRMRAFETAAGGVQTLATGSPG